MPSQPARGQHCGRHHFVDVDQAGALGHCQVGGLAGFHAGSFQDRMRDPYQAAGACGRRELVHHEPDRVAIGARVAFHQSVMLQRGQQPPRRGAVQPTCCREVGERTPSWRAGGDRVE